MEDENHSLVWEGLRQGSVVSMIDSRDGLVAALHEAAELEHGLLLQYLFAALSMKKELSEGVQPEELELVREWEGVILGIARQEMAHLGTVCNLLSAVGASPHFSRPNFPQPPKQYYPFDFRLTRFSDEALYRFIRFELPKGEPPPDPPGSLLTRGHPMLALLDVGHVVPEPLEYEYVGELYGQIEQAFLSLPEQDLFIGPTYAQDSDDWSRRMNLLLVKDRKTGKAAIDSIVMEGEGAPGKRENSHYAKFIAIRKALNDAANANQGFDPARPVLANPLTRRHRDAPGGAPVVTARAAVSVSDLFNAAYEAALLMLVQFYSYGGESAGQRLALRNGIRELMSTALRPLAEILTTLPATEDGASGTAGPTFELFSTVSIAANLPNRWTVLIEHLTAIADAGKTLVAVHPRIPHIAQNLTWLALNIDIAAKSEPSH